MTTARVFWFTGLSGVGKSTIAKIANFRLQKMGFKVLVLDGDVVRNELHRDLGFSKCDIAENNRLISEICVNKKLEYDIILVPIISPYRQSRSAAKEKIGKRFYEIYLHADLETLHERDTKGLYKKMRDGEIDNLIGVSKTSKYESPVNPDLQIDTVNLSVDESVDQFMNFVIKLN